MPIGDKYSKLCGYKGIVGKISEKHSRYYNKESEEMYQALITQMEQGLALHEMIFDKKGKAINYRFVDVNKSFEEITGLKKEFIIGKTVFDVLPGTEKYWIEQYESVVKTGKTLQYENYSKELGRHYHVIAYRPKPNYFAVIVTDITAYKQVEERLRQSENEKHIILSHMVDRVIYHDKNMKVKWANRAALRFFQMPVNEVIGKTCYEMLGRKKEECEDCPVLASFKTRSYHQHTLEFPEGTTLLISATPVFDNRGNFNGVVEVGRDITERIQMEAEKKIARRVINAYEEERSRLARELHDELGMTLTTLKLRLQLLSKDILSENGKYEDDLSRIITLVDNSLEATRKKTAYMRPHALYDMGLFTVIENMLNELGHNTNIKTEFNVMGSYKKLPIEVQTAVYRCTQEALTNVMRHSGAKKVLVELVFTSRQILLRIRDDGVGFEIAPEDEGSHLGIQGMKERVILLDGEFIINSFKGKGTEIKIKIPLGDF